MQQTTAAKVLAMTDEQFKAHAWAILTNRGASRKAKEAAQRRFRRMGGKAYLALQEDEGGYTWNCWGFVFPGEDHDAHILGGGDAREGWRMFFNS